MFKFLKMFIFSRTYKQIVISGLLLISAEVNPAFIYASDSPRYQSGYLMPLGDSLTLGDSSSDGFAYRKYLQDLLGVFTYRFVGSKATGTLQGYQTAVSGRSGCTSAYLKEFIPKEIQTQFTRRDKGLVLLHTGTNDIRMDLDPDVSVRNILDIINVIDSYNPGIKIYVAYPIPVIDKLNQSAEFRQRLKTALMERKKTKNNLFTVDMYQAFIKDTTGLCEGNFENCMEDAFHPLENGFFVMAIVWYRSIIDCKGYALCE